MKISSLGLFFCGALHLPGLMLAAGTIAVPMLSPKLRVKELKPTQPFRG